MEAKATAKYLRKGPRKVRLVTNQLRGLDVSVARDVLKHNEKEAAKAVLKLLDSAVANAVNNLKLNETNLYIKKCFTNSGPILKRIRFGGRGRVKPIKKRTSHIVITVAEKEVT